MRVALEQAVGATAAKAITEIFGTPATENEQGWLIESRDACDNTPPGSPSGRVPLFRDLRQVSDAPINTPTPSAGPWKQLTETERARIALMYSRIDPDHLPRV